MPTLFDTYIIGPLDVHLTIIPTINIGIAKTIIASNEQTISKNLLKKAYIFPPLIVIFSLSASLTDESC